MWALLSIEKQQHATNYIARCLPNQKLCITQCQFYLQPQSRAGSMGTMELRPIRTAPRRPYADKVRSVRYIACLCQCEHWCNMVYDSSTQNMSIRQYYNYANLLMLSNLVLLDWLIIWSWRVWWNIVCYNMTSTWICETKIVICLSLLAWLAMHSVGPKLQTLEPPLIDRHQELICTSVRTRRLMIVTIPSPLFTRRPSSRRYPLFAAFCSDVTFAAARYQHNVTLQTTSLAPTVSIDATTLTTCVPIVV